MAKIAILGSRAQYGRFYGSALEMLPHDVVFVDAMEPASLLEIKPALVVTHDEVHLQARACLLAAREAGIPTLLCMDGILEWRNTWENPNLRDPLLQPALSDKIAVMGPLQERVLISWGNVGKCEQVGAPRLDDLVVDKTVFPPSRFTLLVTTAKRPGFDPRQCDITLRSLRDLKQVLDRRDDLRVVYRLTQGLADALEVESSLDSMEGGELHQLLRRVSAVITTPSTVLLESMLLRLPTACLNYHACPEYLWPAWTIGKRDDAESIIDELISPSHAKRLYQDYVLQDALRVDGPASPRLAALIEAMVKQPAGRRKRPAPAAGGPLIDPPPGVRPSPLFDLSKLYPEHPTLANLDRVQLQLELSTLRRYLQEKTDWLHGQLDHWRREADRHWQAFERARQSLETTERQVHELQHHRDQLAQQLELRARVYEEIAELRQRLQTQAEQLRRREAALSERGLELLCHNDAAVMSGQEVNVLQETLRVLRGDANGDATTGTSMASLEAVVTLAGAQMQLAARNAMLATRLQVVESELTRRAAELERVEAAAREAERLRSRVAELEFQSRCWEEQARRWEAEATALKQQCDELRSVCHSSQLELERARISAAYLDERMKSLEYERNHHRGEAERHYAAYDQVRQQLEAVERERPATWGEELKAAKNALAEREHRLAAASARCGELETQIRSLHEQVENARAETELYRQAAQDAQQARTEFNQRLEREQAAREEVCRQRDGLAERVEALRAALDDAHEEMEHLQAKLAETEAQLAQEAAQRESMEAANEQDAAAWELESARMREELGLMAAALSHAEQEREALAARVRHLEQELTAGQDELTKWIGLERALREELHTLRNAEKEASDRFFRLQHECKTAQQELAQAKMVLESLEARHMELQQLHCADNEAAAKRQRQLRQELEQSQEMLRREHARLAELVEEMRRYRRYFPPYAVKRLAQKLRWQTRRLTGGLGPRGRPAGDKTLVCVTANLGPEVLAELRAAAARQTLPPAALLYPGSERETLSDDGYPPVLFSEWTAQTLAQLPGAPYDWVLVLHPQYYHLGPLADPQALEKWIHCMRADSTVGGVLLRGGQPPLALEWPYHVRELIESDVRAVREEEAAAFFAWQGFAELWRRANPGVARSCIDALCCVLADGKQVLSPPRRFPLQMQAHQFSQEYGPLYTLQESRPRPRQYESTSQPLTPYYWRLPDATNDSRVRVLYVSQYVVQGGADKGIVDLLQGIDPRRYRMFFLSTMASDQCWEKRIRPHVEELVHEAEFLPLPDKPHFVDFLVHYAESRKIDVIHIMHSFIGYDALPVIKQRLPGVKVLDQCHIVEPDWNMEGGHPCYSSRYYKQYLDVRTVTSHHLKGVLMDRFRVPENQIRVIYTGVDARGEFDPAHYPRGAFKRELGLADDVDIVLFLGRFHWQKRPLLFVRMAEEVVRQLNPERLRFVMMGGGEEHDKIVTAVRETGLTKYVLILPGRENVAPVYRDCSLLAMPSHHEGLAYVSFEAMAMKVPQIFTDVGGQKELITPECGVVIANQHEDQVVADLAQNVVALLADSARRDAMAEAGRERILAHFTLDKMVRAYEALYSELAGLGDR